jgi:hypothetical protein
LDLFGDSQEIKVRERVDGAIVRKDFTQEIEAKGGNETAYRESTEAMTRELFGCKGKELYTQTGGKPGKRETLPKEAQKAYIVGEIIATHDLKETEISGNQQERNEKIIDRVRQSGKKTRKLFPW